MENTEMKDRIAHIIRAKNLNAAEFALQLGIQPSNISHLLSGRNNPSLDFVKKLKETFPEYSLDWIIFGRGPITISEPFPDYTPVQSVPSTPVAEQSVESMGSEMLSDQPTKEMTSTVVSVTSSSSTLKQIILVYSDGTFEQISPR